jgi:hypothetical protein
MNTSNFMVSEQRNKNIELASLFRYQLCLPLCSIFTVASVNHACLGSCSSFVQSCTPRRGAALAVVAHAAATLARLAAAAVRLVGLPVG